MQHHRAQHRGDRINHYENLGRIPSALRKCFPCGSVVSIALGTIRTLGSGRTFAAGMVFRLLFSRHSGHNSHFGLS